MWYIIIWDGLGFLVPVIFFGITFAINIPIAMILGESGNTDNFLHNNGWVFFIAPILSGIAITKYAHHLSKEKGTAIILEETGERIVIKQKHTFFFIPMLYWGYFITGAMIIVLLCQAFKPS